MNKKRFLANALLPLTKAPVAAQLRVERLINAATRALITKTMFCLSNTLIWQSAPSHISMNHGIIAAWLNSASMTIRVLRAMLQKHCISTHISMISMTYVLFVVSDRANKMKL